MLARFRHHIPALASIGVRGIGVGLGFLVVIVIGRIWGPEGSGVYGLVSQTAMFLAIVSVGGLDMAAVRSLASIDPGTHRLAVPVIVRLLITTAALAAIPSSMLLFSWDQAIAFLTEDHVPSGALFALIAMLFARALLRMIAAIIQAQRHFLLGQAIDAGLIPGVLCVALLTVVGPELADLLFWLLVSALIAILIALGAVLWAQVKSRRTGLTPQSPQLRAMIATALPLWGVTIALNFADWYGLTVVTAQLGLEPAGIYRVVMQFATAFSLLSAGMFGVYSVSIASAQGAGDWPAVARQVRSATLLSAALVILPASIFIVLAEPLLGLVGPEFTSGAAALRLGLIGQIIYIVLGPAGLTLAMTGHARINLAITLSSTAALLVLAPYAADYWGVFGVVGCISTLLVVRNLVSLLYVRKKLGINALTGRYYPPIRPTAKLTDRE